MREITLRGRYAAKTGIVTLIDDADFDSVSKYDWYPQLGRRSRIPVMRHILSPGKHDTEFLHAFLMNAAGVDHIDGNPLNNQRSNLRLATAGQNAQNAGKRKDARTSLFKGVHFRTRSQRWTAQIQAERSKRHIGYYDTEIEAARAYDDAARLLFGEFARLNFPEGS